MAVYHPNFGGKSMSAQPPSGGDGMDARLTKLETRVETILPTLATKADISDTKAAISASETSIIRVLFVALSIAVGVVLYALNRANPPQQPSQAQQSVQPIIVYPQPAAQPAGQLVTPEPTKPKSK